jgi:hypothetical protein
VAASSGSLAADKAGGDSKVIHDADGFAVVRASTLYIKTVSDTELAAMVNGLVILAGVIPMQSWSSDRVSAEFKARLGTLRYSVVGVTISADQDFVMRG